MQRDEFLPLRVIRQELATGDFTGSRRGSEAAATRRAASVDAPVSTLTPEELLDEAGVSRGAPARAPGVRDRRSPSAATGGRSTTRPTSRSSAPPPSSRGSASPGATCASSGPPPTARRRCSSSSSARRFARAARLAARRRSRTWRAWRRSAGTSSICSSSATCAASKATEGAAKRAGVPSGLAHDVRVRSLVSRLRPRPLAPRRRCPGHEAVIAPSGAGLVSDPHHLPRWWPRTVRVEDVRRRRRAPQPLDDGARDRARQGVRADYRCTGADRRGALRVGAGDRGDAVRADPALRGSSRSASQGRDGSTVVTLASSERLRGLSRLGSPMMRRATGAASTRPSTGSSGR